MNTELNKHIDALKLDKSSWEKVKFGDVAIQQKESVDRDNSSLTRYVKGEHMVSEDLHIREWGDLKDEYLGPAFIRKFSKGDILYGSRRTYLRKVAIADFDGITSNTTFVIKANLKKIDERLLPFIMLSEGFAEHSIKNSKGSVNPYINWKDIANYQFLLPPKDQQARLARLLWALDEVMERVLILSQKLKQSYDTASFKYILGRERLTESNNPKLINSDLGLLPIDWNLVRFKEVADLIHGYQFREHDFTKTGIPIVKIGEIGKEGNLNLSNCTFIDRIRLDEFENRILKNGDILMALTGATLGKICRVSDLSEPVLQNYRVGKFEPHSSLLDKSYLFHFLSSPMGLTQILGKIHQAAQGNIGKSDIEELKIPLPPLEEQRLIGKRLDLILEKKGAIEKKMFITKALQKSLINQIF